MGKMLRINTDGSVPADNPFVGRADTRPEIWAFGVRDAQSIAFDSTGRLWTAENGPMGGDEVELLDAQCRAQRRRTRNVPAGFRQARDDSP